MALIPRITKADNSIVKQMYSEWYIKLYRKLLENPISYNIELLWFLAYLLLEVNHTEQDIYKGNQKIHLMPWERIISQRALWERFSISISKVHRFIKILEEENILEHQWSSSFTIVKLLNWDTYNWIETQTESKKNTKRTREETKQEWKQWEEWKEDISKDIWEQALVIRKWNEDINELLEIVKWQVEFLWLIYKKWKYERERAKNIITGKDFWEVCEKANMSRIEFCKNIIYMSTLTTFWNGKINNAETLYKYYAQVYNEAVNLKAKKQKDTSLTVF